MSESIQGTLGAYQPNQPRTEKHGLFKLAESQPDPSESETYPVDIIAVHGLNGDAYSTWTHSSTGALWLRDFLPGFLPGCCVYTYGYPSKLFCEVSRGPVQEFGRGLLASGTRPIIFVCHSLGGIVCKQALVFAHEDDNAYGAVLKSTIGVVFLATPHAGSDGANLASIFLTIVNTFRSAATAGWRPRAARTELLDYLSRNSDALQDLVVSVRHRLQNLSVVSFYETQATAPLSFLDPIPLETLTSYIAVAKALRGIVRQSPGVGLALRRASTPSSYRTLSDVERTCMALLNDSDVAKHAEVPPKPVPGTCQWIRSHHLFLSWLENDTDTLLWLTGHPGFDSESRTVFVYLCQNKSKQTDGREVLIGLISQAIERHRSMVRHSFSSLWAGTLHVILDALDECEPVSCHQLLDSISDLLADSSHTRRSNTTVKFLTTSRPFLYQSYAQNKQPLQHRIAIGETQRVDDISLNRRYSTSRADRTFLWTHVVLASVEKSLLTSRRDFQDIIASIPEDLTNTYKRYFSRPLNLDELNIAFTMDPSHAATEDVMRDTQNAIAHTVQGILGPLVRVSGSQVSLVHQSVKEFLLEQVAGKYESFPAMRTVDAQSSALRLATSAFQMTALLDELPMGDLTGEAWDEGDHNLKSDMLFRGKDEYGFYGYASLHWAEHFAICEESASSQLREAARLLLDVTTASCRNWRYFYSTQAVTSLEDSLVDQNPIVLAAQFDLHTILQELLGSYQDTQAIKNRSLYWASRLNRDRIVASLLIAGAEPDSTELEMQTALTTAAEHGNLACILTLLGDERTNINIAGRRGRSALSFACGGGHENIVKELLSRSSCNADDPDDSVTTPFLWAVGGGHNSIISSLARHPGIDINHQDKTGRTAASWAAGDGMDATLKHLLKLSGKSPLSWAAGNGRADAAEVLLQSRLRNAISWVCEGGNHDTLFRLLDKGCPGVDAEDIDGWTPLAWAIQNDSPKTVQALIDTTLVQIERRDHAGRTALSWAVEYGHISIVRAESSGGRTPISITEQFERYDLLSELLTYKS
ncbi:ankyrin repeat-containing domain protein [Dactylonectria estremocensis]|uniref:Ankyrin repeat-containing domain protein n=1 Tax=Dactylonectria estremocensis TaxID=1079267 RepID=A0A9P9JBC4_9HYPO|nr:ankyrin repeat-containing domain protein [Dactylonectria estremocensis]